MQKQTVRFRALRTIAALAMAVLALSACGDQPLQGVGERSGEWIGPLAEEMVLLP